MTDADDHMSKPTRGPWRVEGGCVVAPWSELSPVKMHDGEIRMHPTGLIALVYGCPDPGERYSGPEANAHLIAAAPELYAALRRLVATNRGNADEHEPGCGCSVHEAEAAIARAEGR